MTGKTREITSLSYAVAEVSQLARLTSCSCKTSRLPSFLVPIATPSWLPTTQVTSRPYTLRWLSANPESLTGRPLREVPAMAIGAAGG